MTETNEKKEPSQQPGVYITYKVVYEDIPDTTDMSDTISKLQKRVEKYSGKAVVYQTGVDVIGSSNKKDSKGNEVRNEEE